MDEADFKLARSLAWPVGEASCCDCQCCALHMIDKQNLRVKWDRVRRYILYTPLTTKMLTEEQLAELTDLFQM